MHAFEKMNRRFESKQPFRLHLFVLQPFFLFLVSFSQRSAFTIFCVDFFLWSLSWAPLASFEKQRKACTTETEPTLKTRGKKKTEKNNKWVLFHVLCLKKEGLVFPFALHLLVLSLHQLYICSPRILVLEKRTCKRYYYCLFLYTFLILFWCERLFITLSWLCYVRRSCSRYSLVGDFSCRTHFAMLFISLYFLLSSSPLYINRHQEMQD